MTHPSEADLKAAEAAFPERPDNPLLTIPINGYLADKRRAFLAGLAEGRKLERKVAAAVEALKYISLCNKAIGFEGHNGPSDDRYWYKQEMASRDAADKALATLQPGQQEGKE